MNENPEWLNKIVTLPEINTNIKLFGGHKQRVEYPWIAERETHFSFEVMIILEGVQHTSFSGRAYDFSAESIVLIPPGTSHENSCASNEGLKYFCAHFDIDDPSIQQTLLMYCPILLRKENEAYGEIARILHTYVELLDNESFSLKEKLIVEKLLIELVIALLDYANYEKIKMESSDNSSLVLAKAIADTIQQNFRKFTKYPTEENRYLLSMNYVAANLNISESTMLKVLKKVYGVSPKKYLDQLRYNESKFLLHQPNLSISEIAEVVGYQNLSHFSRQFKTWCNASPNEYRHLNHKNSKIN
ncbi:AraC family transcriptional regulator [Enterococcus sp. AZ196]|uniref:AraC family transcriptional regulator n=1 Tax=Enterococcus sp. AZ196 TaxID=2774659 RepID=UPI003D2C6D36